MGTRPEAVMGSARDFERDERRAAENFAAAAGEASVRRIIYLGGLGNPEHGLSSHLRSRQETGRILRESGVQSKTCSTTCWLRSIWMLRRAASSRSAARPRSHTVN